MEMPNFKKFGFDKNLYPPLTGEDITKIKIIIKNLKSVDLDEEGRADLYCLENLLIHDEETKDWLDMPSGFI